MREFSTFNIFLLSLFEVSNAYFMIIFELTFKRKYVKPCKQFKFYHEMRLKR